MKLPEVTIKGASSAKDARYLAVSMDGDWYYWRVHSEGVDDCELDAIPAGETIIRTSERDVCMNPGRARGRVLKTRLINRLRQPPVWFKKSGLIYATPETYRKIGHARVTPLSLAVTDYRQRHNAKLPFVFGIMLGSEELALSLAWVIHEDGSITGPAVMTGHGEQDRQQAQNDVLEMGDINEEVESSWVAPEELLNILNQVRWSPYPLGDEWAGIPRDYWLRTAAGIAAVYALVGFFHWYKAKSHKDTLVATQAQLKQTGDKRAAIKHLLVTHPNELANAVTVNWGQALQAARSQWQLGTTETIHLHKAGVSVMRPHGLRKNAITLKVNLNHLSHSNNSHQAWMDKQGLENALKANAPEGWALSGMKASSDGHQFEVTYEEKN